MHSPFDTTVSPNGPLGFPFERVGPRFARQPSRLAIETNLPGSPDNASFLEAIQTSVRYHEASDMKNRDRPSANGRSAQSAAGSAQPRRRALDDPAPFVTPQGSTVLHRGCGHLYDAGRSVRCPVDEVVCAIHRYRTAIHNHALKVICRGRPARCRRLTRIRRERFLDELTSAGDAE